MSTHLESYLESVSNLPNDVKRNFSAMRELDTQSQALLDKLEIESRTYLKKQRNTKDKSVVTDDRELQKIRNEYQHAMQLGDQKVDLALQTYEIVDKHIRRLDSDLKKFELELEQDQNKTDKKGKKGKGTTSTTTAVVVGKNSKQSKNTARNGGHIDTTSSSSSSSSSSKGQRRKSDTLNLPPDDARVLNVDIDMPIDPNEPTYCLCNRVSFGEMVGCDNADCKIEWFHFECVGLTSPPKGKWYCPACASERKQKMLKK